MTPQKKEAEAEVLVLCFKQVAKFFQVGYMYLTMFYISVAAIKNICNKEKKIPRTADLKKSLIHCTLRNNFSLNFICMNNLFGSFLLLVQVRSISDNRR